MAPTSASRVAWTDLRRAPQDPRPPAALVVALAFLAELSWVVLAQALDLPSAAGIVGVVVIAVVSAWWTIVPASVSLALVGLLVADGFVQNQMGQLSWDGNHDGLLILALLIGCALTAEVRSGLIEDRRRRRGTALPEPHER